MFIKQDEIHDENERNSHCLLVAFCFQMAEGNLWPKRQEGSFWMRLFINFMILIPSSTFTEFRVVSMEHLEWMRHSSRERLPFLTPGSVHFWGLAYAPIIEASYPVLAVSFLNFPPWRSPDTILPHMCFPFSLIVPTGPRQLNIEFIRRAPPQVRLTWLPPKNSYGFLTNYTLHWGVRNGAIRKEVIYPGVLEWRSDYLGTFFLSSAHCYWHRRGQQQRFQLS